MKNVTITVDEEVARWARIAAAKREMSLSRYIGELLREHMQELQAYEQAMHEYLALPALGGSGGQDRPSRDEIHDRASLRRQ
jgi:hypothetical protein